jgi:uncharacterized membrane protein YqjE
VGTAMTQVNEPATTPREKSMGELFNELSTDLSTLVRQELQLARAEMTEKGKQAGFGAGMFGGAGIVVLLAAGTLSACLIGALSLAVHVWLAALIVTCAYLVLAGVLALIAKQRVTRATPPVPKQTVETMKEDMQWAKTQLPSGSR